MTRNVPHRQDSRRTARPPLFDPYGSDGGPQAACLGRPDLFFHPDGERGTARRRRANQAKTICATCPLAQPCAHEALTNREPHGTWGGLTDDDRVRIHAERDEQLVSA